MTPDRTKKVMLCETYEDSEGEEHTIVKEFSSRFAVIKDMRKKGYPALCVYDLTKHGRYVGYVFGQFRILEFKDAPKEEIKSVPVP